jgi:hypothetical protein
MLEVPDSLVERLKARQVVLVAGQKRKVTVELVVLPPPVEAERPVYKKWWFWTGIGVVVAGGVVAAILISQSGGTARPECTASGGCM